MYQPRSFLLVAFGLLTAAFAAAPTLPQAPTLPMPAGPFRDDPAALRTLEQAVKALDMERLRWIKAGLWQKASLPTLNYQSEGTYVSGPDHRLLLDLKVQVGSTTSRLHVVSDGRTLWQVEKVGTGERSVGKVALEHLLETLRRPETTPAHRAEFYGYQFFGGPVPLLQGLRSRLTFVRQENVQWRGKSVRLLTGVRKDEAAASGVPRQCRLFMDAQTLWPHRLEWWGPGTEASGDSLLLEVEFRDPVLLPSVPESVFTFDPGRGKVTDMTRQWTEELAKGITGPGAP